MVICCTAVYIVHSNGADGCAAKIARSLCNVHVSPSIPFLFFLSAAVHGKRVCADAAILDNFARRTGDQFGKAACRQKEQIRQAGSKSRDDKSGKEKKRRIETREAKSRKKTQSKAKNIWRGVKRGGGGQLNCAVQARGRASCDLDP